MSNKVILKASGIYTNLNSLGSVPDGALLQANNVVIDKEDVIEPRRGFKIFGEEIGTTGTNRALQLIEYKNRIYRHFEPNSIEGRIEYQDSPGSTGFSELLDLKMQKIASLTSVSTTATVVTSTPHGIIEGDQVIIENASPTGYNGTFSVSNVVNSTEFNYTIPSPVAANTGNAFIYASTLNDAREVVNGVRIKSEESNSNLYFTTQNGVKKIDTFNAIASVAGAPRALDTTLELYNEPGFLTQNNTVGYRIVWGIKDFNENLILGSPSERSYIALDGTTLFSEDFNQFIVTLTGQSGIVGPYSQLPDNASLPDIQSGILETIETLTGESGITDDATLTGAYYSITGDSVTIDELQSAYNDMVDVVNIQTSPTGQFDLARTSQQVKLNFTVPEGITPNHFYQLYRTSLSQSLDVLPSENFQLVYENNPTYDEISNGFVTIVDITPDALRGVELYTNPNQEGDAQANERPPLATDLALYNEMLFYSNTKTIHRLQEALISVDGLSNTSTLQFTQGSNSFTITFSTTTENATSGIARIYTEGTVAQNLEDTARSIVKCVNRYTSNMSINAFYISGPNDVPGLMLFESINLEDPAFTVIATNSTINNDGDIISVYSPTLITEQTSSNEAKTNRIYYSKLGEPEAVPLLNFFSVGGGDNVIRRIQSLRDNLFIFTDDGIFRVNGDTPTSLSLVAFDRTVLIKAPEALVKGNNQIFAFSDEGVITVSETGVNIISYQIEDQLLKLLDVEYENFETATFGTYYSSDRKYILSTVTDPSDSYSTQSFIYNTVTKTWVSWPISKVKSIALRYGDKLYWSAADTNYIEQERKNFDYTDHADREYTKTILSVNRRITNITADTRTQITAKFHGLQNGDLISITNSNSTPSINGQYEVDIVDDDSFLIDVNVTIAGNTGVYSVINRDVPVVLEMTNVDNLSVQDVLTQTLSNTVNTTTYNYQVESDIVEIDELFNTVTIDNKDIFGVGTCTSYAHIPLEVEWTPIHAGDTAILKQFSELHLMFDKFKAKDVDLIFSSDIQSNDDVVEINVPSDGSWGSFPWGTQPWGGALRVANVRTYVPRGKQKCRLLNFTFQQGTCREQWRLEGVTLTFRPLSQRTNKDQ